LFLVLAPQPGRAGTVENAGARPVSAATPDASAKVAGLPEMVARIDELHRRRDELPAVAEERKLVDRAVAQAPTNFEVLWRAARLYFWLSDDPGSAHEQRSRLGKVGWDLAERAIVSRPDQPAGYYWAAATMGSYALGLGVMKALTQGLEDKFKTRLSRAEQLAPGYQYGGVQVAWGRFYEKLPWPKRDRKKAEGHLRRVLTDLNRNNLRARVYLADTLANDDRPAEAKQLLEEVMAAPLGRYDLPEERRAKALAVGLLPSVLKRMK
jgi:hypothetical protein